MAQVPVTEVLVEDRVRVDLGDLSELMVSIDELGLLHPIVVDPSRRLIAGERRLEAVKLLGLPSIECTVVSTLDGAARRLRAELEENSHRKAFTPSEMVRYAERLEGLVKAEAQARMTLGKSSLGSETGKAADQVAAAVGTSAPTLAKAKAVVDAADEGIPEAVEAKAEMDRTGKVAPAHRKVQDVKDPILKFTDVAHLQDLMSSAPQSRRQQVQDEFRREFGDKWSTHLRTSDLPKALAWLEPRLAALWAEDEAEEAAPEPVAAADGELEVEAVSEEAVPLSRPASSDRSVPVGSAGRSSKKSPRDDYRRRVSAVRSFVESFTVNYDNAGGLVAVEHGLAVMSEAEQEQVSVAVWDAADRILALRQLVPEPLARRQQ